MKRGLLTRLARLESRTTAEGCCLKIRFGQLKRLPLEYAGERHVVTRELQNMGGQESLAFEEVSGPDPNPPACPGGGRRRPIATYLDVMFVDAYARQEQP
jgi:hypothetical protein